MSREAERLAQTQAALDEAPDWQAAVARLARLPGIEYDRCRESKAAALGCRVGTLDDAVREARGRDEPDGQGQPLEFRDVGPWPAPVDGTALFDELVGAITRYVILPQHGAEACALWAVMTWVGDDLDCLPLLRVLSPTRGCGKSTLLEVMAELVHRPLAASGVTPAALFRTIELHRPTMLLDEADTFLKESEDHRQILNAGHTRAAANVIRCVGDAQEPRAFNVFGPKLVAVIGNLPGTIEDRAVRVELRKRAPGESIASLRRDGRERFIGLRQRICRFTDDNRAAIVRGAASASMPTSLPDRAADNWSPLVAIADAAGGEWAARARRAAVALTKPEDLAELSVQLLGDIRDLFDRKGTDRLASQAICDELAQLEERPWGEFKRGKPIAPRQLARQLKGFGVVSGSIREPGGATPKGYYRAALEDAFSRYLPNQPSDPPQRHNAAIAGAFDDPFPPQPVACGGYKRHTPHPVADEIAPEPRETQACGVVADRHPENAAGGNQPMRGSL